MPVVIGHPTSTRCLRASAPRISLIVVSLPFGTLRMISSTSIGAGMTIVPVPQRVVIFPSILPTLGNPLLSASFSRQDFLALDFGREFTTQLWRLERAFQGFYQLHHGVVIWRCNRKPLACFHNGAIDNVDLRATALL